jgi:hypothetical protein
VAEREGEQHEHEEGERHDLVERHPGARLQAEVLAGDEQGVTDHATPPVEVGAGDADEAGDAGGSDAAGRGSG